MLTNKQNIRNISQSLNTNGEIISTNDSISVHSLVDEMTKNGSNTVLYYKRENVKCAKYPFLNEENFVLIITTKVQE